MRIGVVGPDAGGTTDSQEQQAERVGELLADSGATLICGGLGGIMEASCRGAHRLSGTTIGLLPGFDTAGANRYLTLALPTGLGDLRNGLIVNATQATICIGGSWGTLSEIALAIRARKLCVGLDSWTVRGEDILNGGKIQTAQSAEEAVRIATAAASTQM